MTRESDGRLRLLDVFLSQPFGRAFSVDELLRKSQLGGRTTLGPYISDLRALGCDIESVRNFGYRLNGKRETGA